MNIGDLSPLLLEHIYLFLTPEVFIASDPLMMGKFNHIPELTGASVFQAWKTQIILTLGCEGVYNHVSDGTDPTDFAELASHLPTPADPDTPTSGELKLIQDWLKDDAIAKDIICRQLSPAILQLVPQERSSTARDAWQLLHSHLDHIDLGSQYLVREKILGLQMKDAKDAQRYLGEHDSLRQELIWMQVAYTDSEAIFNLLKGLPHTSTWTAFKLVLQTSISSSAAGISLSTSASASAATSSKGKLPASIVSAVPGSSISHLLSTAGGTTFESVSTCIAVEAHRQVLEATLLSPLGVEYAHAVSAPTQSGRGGVVNPAMGLRRTKNNPSGTYCDTLLDDGTTCGLANHDRAHCFKPGGGMAGQQPVHWRQPQGKGHSTSIPSSTPVPAGSSSSSATVPAFSSSIAPLAASAVPVLPSAWATRDYDLSCTSVVDVTNDQPSDEVLACLSAPGHTCIRKNRFAI